ncbi:hypothetical protein AGDE_09306 [Angomonas deanei]|nr:hypothetical protein AGDE_09306 [Angomonas deanei]|eukprot:EPY30707.1 hypothetical protein AGDE_09306 [Angomonas deanei]
MILSLFLLLVFFFPTIFHFIGPHVTDRAKHLRRQLLLDRAVLPLSTSICPAPDENTCWDETVAYRVVSVAERKLKRGCGHPHCTLVQTCVRATDLTEIKDVVEKVARTYRDRMDKCSLTLQGVSAGPVFNVLSDGTEARLPYVGIVRSEELQALHQEMTEALEKYRVHVKSPEVGAATFHKKFPVVGTASVEYMEEFNERCGGENYNPHITIGASPLKSLEKLVFFQKTEVPWRQCSVVVSHMGNYCSCFEILEGSK